VELKCGFIVDSQFLQACKLLNWACAHERIRRIARRRDEKTVLFRVDLPAFASVFVLVSFGWWCQRVVCGCVDMLRRQVGSVVARRRQSESVT
jgi:hypothetical protein